MDQRAERPGNAARRSTIQFDNKGSVLVGLIRSLKSAKLFEEVLEHLDPETRALALSPPPASTWIGCRPVMEMHCVLFDLHGGRVLRSIALDTVRNGLSPFLRTSVESVLRLFGASPASLLSRMTMLAGSTTRGVEWKYTPESPRAGVLEMRYSRGANAPMSAFVSAAGGLEFVMGIAGVTGTISNPEVVPDGLASAARYYVRW